MGVREPTAPHRRRHRRALVVTNRSSLIAQCLQVALEQAGISTGSACDDDDLMLEDVDSVIACDATAAERVAGLIGARGGQRDRARLIVLDSASVRHADVQLSSTATANDLVEAVRHGQLANARVPSARPAGDVGEQVPPPDSWPSSSDAGARLTSRERQVVALLLSGATNDRMAGTLGVSPHTIRTHIQNVMTKFGVTSRLEVASIAAEYEHVLPYGGVDAPPGA